MTVYKIRAGVFGSQSRLSCLGRRVLPPTWMEIVEKDPPYWYKQHISYLKNKKKASDKKGFQGVDPERVCMVSRSLVEGRMWGFDLTNAQFTRCNMESATISGCRLNSTEFERCNLMGSSFMDSEILSSTMDRCILSGSQFCFSQIYDLDLTTCSIDNVWFRGCTIREIALPDTVPAIKNVFETVRESLEAVKEAGGTLTLWEAAQVCLSEMMGKSSVEWMQQYLLCRIDLILIASFSKFYSGTLQMADFLEAYPEDIDFHIQLLDTMTENVNSI